MKNFIISIIFLLAMGFTTNTAVADNINPASTIVINNNNSINFPRRTYYTTRVVHRHRSLEKYGYIEEEEYPYEVIPTYRTECHASTGCYRVGFARPVVPKCRARRYYARPARPLDRTKVRCISGGYQNEITYKPVRHIDPHKNSRFRASNQIASNKKTVCNGITYYGNNNPCSL